MADLRSIGAESVERAVGKAERYRLLNEPREAESICEDVLAVDPGNAEARRILLLAVTDQFDGHNRDLLDRSHSIVETLETPFDRKYHAGVIAERWGKSMLDAGMSKSKALDYLNEALTAFDEAMRISPSGNDDAILRWNTCVRVIRRYGLDMPDYDPDREARIHAEVESAWDDIPN